MRYSKDVKEKVRLLRSTGKTYTEIMCALGVQIPKNTLSNWCSDVRLPLDYIEKIKNLNAESFNKARKIAWASNKIKQENLLQKLEQDNKALPQKIGDKDVLKMLLSILYLGEGSKWKSHSGAVLGSSDPNIITLYTTLLKLCYGIQADQLKCRISYRADQDINQLQQYWSDTTRIPLKNFYRTTPDPRTIGKPTQQKEYKGVCVVSGPGTKIQLELELIPKIILSGLLHNGSASEWHSLGGGPIPPRSTT